MGRNSIVGPSGETLPNGSGPRLADGQAMPDMQAFPKSDRIIDPTPFVGSYNVAAPGRMHNTGKAPWVARAPASKTRA